MSWVWQHSAATGSDRLVLLAIADEADDQGLNAFPSVATISRKARVDRSTTLRALERLEHSGEIVTMRPETRGRGRTNRYGVVMDRDLEEVSALLSGETKETSQSDTISHQERSLSATNTRAGETSQPATNTGEEMVAERSRIGGRKVASRVHNPDPDPYTPIPNGIGDGASTKAPSLPDPDQDWGPLKSIETLCRQLGAEDLLDLEYWKRVDALTEGTQIYYDDQLRKYIAWWETKPPSARHRNRRRGFMNWIKEDISRENWRKRRAAIS